jgi:pimeloyl-ACP methyl ester carboxylesterase
MPIPVPLELLHDFGGDGPIIHLAHANGFPPATYSPFAECLIAQPSAGSVEALQKSAERSGQGFHVIGLPARPLWPDSRPESAPDWHSLADDLIRGLDALDLRDIIGVGHSMGGVFTLLAAIRRPELFRIIVLIDPVILPPATLRTLWLMRRLGQSQRQPLVKGALRRRRTWPNRQDCYERYRSKPFFGNWPDASLRAYVEAGTRQRPDGQVELVYPPEWEAHIFGTAPTDIWRHVPQLDVLTLVIRGEYSNTFRIQSQTRMQRLLPEARFHVIPEAGHLVPMESPAETAAVVLRFLAEYA